MMVTLALTSIMVTLAFLGYGNLSRLLKQFSDQGHFIIEMNSLNERLHSMAASPGSIEMPAEGIFKINSDSLEVVAEIKQEAILLKHRDRADTFHLATKNLEVTFEKKDEFANPLVKTFAFDVYYQEQKFHLSCSKIYDAYTLLKKERENE